MSLEQQLLQRLAVFNPSHLEVVNESAGHGGYFPGKEYNVIKKFMLLWVTYSPQVKFMHWQFMPLLHLNGRDKTPAVQNAPTHQKHRNGLK